MHDTKNFSCNYYIIGSIYTFIFKFVWKLTLVEQMCGTFLLAVWYNKEPFSGRIRNPIYTLRENLAVCVSKKFLAKLMLGYNIRPYFDLDSFPLDI